MGDKTFRRLHSPAPKNGIIPPMKRVLAYVYVDSSDVCIARIAARVKNGGHPVPDADVRRRYTRSKRNFLDVYAPRVDHWMLYYNGGADLTLVAHGNGEVIVLSQERFDAFKEDVCLK